jgi:Flp pilus assembly protein TadD
MLKKIFAVMLLSTTLPAFTAFAAFADTETPAPTAQSYYEEARKSLENNKWKPALANLKEAVKLDPNNADIHNLLGYSYRKAGDLPKAFEHYGIALKLNPKHVGALEYRGEAYLMANDLGSAEQALKTLEGLCGTSCSEYATLSKAIAEYKARQ